MLFPERFSDLPEYAFPRLRALLGEIPPGGDVLLMSIGEPKHPFPDWVGQVLADNIADFGKYPPNDGSPDLLEAISGWIGRRFSADVSPDRIMGLNGTREGLFNAVLALCPETKAGARPLVLVPNPFYQVYAVGALAAVAEPRFIPATAETGFLPDYAALPPEVLDRTAIVFVCSPSNPQGAVASRDYLANLLDLAEKHDFRVFADECYSEIYPAAPPPGLIEVGTAKGADPERMVIFHSLSKRSNLPGLRSGFVAAGPESMRHLRRLRAYAGAPVPLPIQRVAERLWADDTHVDVSRALYTRKFTIADRIFADIPGAGAPEAGFFLWLPVDDGEAATLKLWRETGIRVLPGAYLARDIDGENPGKDYIRVAMVTRDETELEAGLLKLRDCVYA